MIECIVNFLVDKFGIKRDVAFLFYFEVMNRHRLEHLIQHLQEFKSFEELKKYYLGGN